MVQAHNGVSRVCMTLCTYQHGAWTGTFILNEQKDRMSLAVTSGIKRHVVVSNVTELWCCMLIPHWSGMYQPL